MNIGGSYQPDARKLIHTADGKKWLTQFDEIDQEAAILLANSLTLISHSEFSRGMESQINAISSGYTGKVALFAVREIDQTVPFFEQVSLDKSGTAVSSVSQSADQGSEAIIAQMIRQICKANPEKFLNHPIIEVMRQEKCNSIFFVCPPSSPMAQI